MRPTFVLTSFLFACGLAGIGCGSLDGKTETPTTLATIRGELSNPQAVPTSHDVHIALVWVNQGGKYSVAQDLPVQPVFPSQFVLQLNAPPPASATLTPANAPYQAAYGFVVAYEDVNGNGQLDLVEDSAGAFIDKVVGANTTMGVAYLTGDLSALANAVDSFGNKPTLGYSFYALTKCTDAPCDSLGLRSQWFPIGTAYDLTVATDPEVNQLMCATYGQSGSASGGLNQVWYVDHEGVPPGGYPAAGTSGLACAADGTSYTASQCRTIHTGLCTEEQDCTGITVELGTAPKPAAWPCP